MRSKALFSAGHYRFAGTAILGAAMGLAPVTSGFAQAMPELSVGLKGRVRSIEGQRTEHLAVVELEWIPPAGARHAAVSLTDVDADLENAPGTEVPLDPLERDDATGPIDAPNGRGRGRGGQTKQKRMLEAIPFVISPAFAREVIDAALRSQGVTPALARLDGLSHRAKNSAVLPEVRLRAGRDADQSLRLSPTTDDPYRYTQSGGVSFVIEGAVTWRLGRLAFASEELSIERLRLAQARERQRVSQLTLQELLAWQTAWRRSQAFGGEVSTAIEDLQEATLRLDLLTDGWFSAHQPGGSKSPAEPEERDLGPTTLPKQRSEAARRRPVSAEHLPRRASPGLIPEVRPNSAGPRLPRASVVSQEPSVPSVVSDAQQQKVASKEPPPLEGLALSR